MMKKWIVSLFMLLLTLSLACSFVQKLVPGLLKTTADDMSVKL
jgi:hypothetical protein